MAVEFKDYYKTLGVDKKASDDEIRKAFRTLARQYHPDVAKNKTRAIAKSFACDADASLIDGLEIFGVAVAGQHRAAATESIRDNAIGASIGVTTLNREDAFRMSEIPHFATTALLECGEHKLSAHGTVTNEAAFAKLFKEGFFHRGDEVVAGGGIEPPTQGFSVLCSTN